MDSTNFLERMSADHTARRRTKYVDEIKQHPQFKASMLQPAKKPFKGEQRARALDGICLRAPRVATRLTRCCRAIVSACASVRSVEVQIGQTPIVVTHTASKTGHETKKPHDWGPLGGW